MDEAGKRIEVLLEWRDQAAAEGHAVPTVPDMMRIGAAGEVEPVGIDAVAVQPWAQTISHLLKQLKFGVVDPMAHMPEELSRPTAVAAAAAEFVDVPASVPEPPTTPAATEDPVLVALRAWWRAERGSDPTLKPLKEHHLRNIAMTGSRTEEEIRRHLPSTLAPVARRLAEVVARSAPVPVVEAVAMAAGPRPAHADVAPPPGAPSRRAPGDPPTAPNPMLVKAGAGRPDPPPGPAPTAADQDAGEFADLELADYAYTPAEREPVEVRRRVTPAGPVLTWPPAEVPHATVLYRVVSADDRWAPVSPQAGEPLIVTDRPTCRDDRPFQGPVRQVQVWRHAGRDAEDAAAAEPVLHARGLLVAQVSGVRIGEDGASIVGQWTVPPGVESVEVLRVPREQARRDGHSGAEHRLAPHQPFVNGFVDDGAERGRRYVYELSVEVEVEGARLRSDPVKVEVAVSAVLAPVTDLGKIDRPDQPSVFDLHWTRPGGGEVRIYRTKEPPAAGIGERPRPAEVLAQARLTDDTVVGRPIERRPDGGSAMVGVAWPDGWTFAYLTPVTILDGRAAVGPSLSVVRLDRVRDAKIVERTHRQVLTFAWPEGADSVLAYVGGPRQDFEGARRGEPEEIGHEQYVAQGGMYFRSRLAPRGCSVHLVPVAYNRGQQITGPPVSLDYPGLMQLWYRVRIERDRSHQAIGLTLQIHSEFDNGSSPPFALVHRLDRLPLHEKDGTAIPMRPHGDPRATGGAQFRPSGLWTTPGEALWTVRLAGGVGYVRLFACLPPGRESSVALFDPAVDDLRLAHPRAGRP